MHHIVSFGKLSIEILGGIIVDSSQKQSGRAFKSLSTDQNLGLTTVQAQALLTKYGPNRCERKRKKTNLQRFFDQFRDVMILILVAAGLVSFVIACYRGRTKRVF